MLDIIISIHASREGCDWLVFHAVLRCVLFLSTHPVRDATQKYWAEYDVEQISIHASREGCDFMDAMLDALFEISIHASREGCDAVRRTRPCCRPYFYPRIP